MANVLLEYGPYNSKSDSKREYEARDIGRMFDGIVTDGVFPYIGKRFLIEQETGLTIKVNTGRAWFNHTWNYLDSPMLFKLENGDPLYPRYDIVILQIGCSELVRENKIIIKKGSASENPVPPELEIYEESQYQYVLGYIKVNANADDTVENLEITNLVGNDEDPNAFYRPGEFAEWAYAIGDNHIGVKRVLVDTNNWNEDTGSDGTKFYWKEINITGVNDDAVFSHDLWVEGTNITEIQKQENAFSYIFKLTVSRSVLKIYSYYIPDVSYTIRFIGKGVSNTPN